MSEDNKKPRQHWERLLKATREAQELARKVLQDGLEQTDKTRGSAVSVLRELIDRQWETIEAIEKQDWPTARMGALEDLDYMIGAMQAFLGVPASNKRAPGYFHGERQDNGDST